MEQRPESTRFSHTHFNSSRTDWYFGTNRNPPSGKYDFVTVVLHEIGHGLGFVGSMNKSGNQGSWGRGTQYPFIFDTFAVNGSGEYLIDTTLFPNPSIELGNQLTSGNLFFEGDNAIAGAGGFFPRLYAPSTWKDGASYSHLDDTRYPAGDVNSLMTPFLDFGEAIHNPGPITLGLFTDIGWARTANCRQSNGVILYWNKDYDCSNGSGDVGYRQRTSTGWENITGAFDNQASSIKILVACGLNTARNYLAGLARYGSVSINLNWEMRHAWSEAQEV